MSDFISIHHPRRLRTFHLHLIGGAGSYFDEEATQQSFTTWMEKTLLPDLDRYNNLVKKRDIFLRISGTTIELCLDGGEGMLNELKSLFSHPHFHFAATTYYHSDCGFFSKPEYNDQLLNHAALVKRVFGKQTVGYNITLPPGNNSLMLLQKLFRLEKAVRQVGDEALLRQWRLLQDRTYHTDADSRYSLQHILTDLELTLIRKRLSGMKARLPQHTFLL